MVPHASPSAFATRSLPLRLGMALLVGGALVGLAGLVPGPPSVQVARSPASTGRLQEIWYHTGYPGGVGGAERGMSAERGPTKMPAIFEAICREKLVLPQHLHTDSPGVEGHGAFGAPIDLASLRAVHGDPYLKALFTGEPEELALSQGLPRWTPEIARGWLLNVGGLAQAAETALAKGILTGNLGHGYHHAGQGLGMGYCTLNGLAAVAHKMLREGRARRVMILDLDEHEGNGTGEIVLGDPRIWNVTIHGSRMVGPPGAPNNHVLRVGHGLLGDPRARDLHYLAVLADTLPGLLQRFDPDLILYQAGMDPFDGSGISPQALAIRDAYVFGLARTQGRPLTWVLAGGYAPLPTLVQLHLGTVDAANRVLEACQPGDALVHHRRDPYTWAKDGGVLAFPDWKALHPQPLRVTRPLTLNEAQAAAFAATRERKLREQRLPEADLQAAYARLVDGTAPTPRR